MAVRGITPMAAVDVNGNGWICDPPQLAVEGASDPNIATSENIRIVEVG
jgi:hypothetical protein